MTEENPFENFEVPPFNELMALEPHGPDVYVGTSPHYPWGRVYGGQVVAQALHAAALTVEEGYHAHSLHSYFIRGGTSDEPIRFEVDRIRNGRSFVTRRVVARQSDGAIFNLSCSFQIDEDQADVQESHLLDDVGEPGSGDSDDWGFMNQRIALQEKGRTATWMKVADTIGDSRILQSCGLAFASDEMPMSTIRRSHPLLEGVERGDPAYYETFIGASLDHAIWFHRQAKADDWLLYDFRSHGLTGGRGLATGEVFTPGGLHVATVVQEGLFRQRTR